MTDHLLISRRLVFVSVLLMFLIVLLAGGSAVYVVSDPDLKQSMALTSAALDVQARYPGNLDWDAMLESAMRAMLNRLDRYSGYVPNREFDQMREELSGAYGGIGVSVLERDEGLLIMSVRESGPAAQAALLAGDIIVMADSVRLAALSGDEATGLLRGPESTWVNLQIVRPVSGDTLDLRVMRQKIDLLHIPFAGLTHDSLLYIRVLDFAAGATDDLRAALDSLLAPGRTPAAGIILDLRGNPGGLLSEAHRTAELFLEEGRLIVGTEARSRWDETTIYSTGDDLTDGLPIVVLIDGASASAAEIVAGALRQNDRAVLVGDTTFGKGLVQGFTRFTDGSGLRLTVSRYYLEGDVFLNELDSSLNDIGHGLPPDHFYRSERLQEFPRRLERTLLLQEFAALHQEEIVATGPNFALPEEWTDRFREFAVRNDFKYESRAALQAKMMIDFAKLERARVSTYKAVQRLQRLVKKDDGEQFDKFSRYIRMRIKQIAWERQFGTYRSYADVIIQERSDIRTAAELIKRMNRVD